MQAALVFEQRFYDTYKTEGKTLTAMHKDDKYVNFKDLINEFAQLANISENDVSAVTRLCHNALHNRLPDGGQGWCYLLPQKSEVDISDIGKAQLSLLNSWLAK